MTLLIVAEAGNSSALAGNSSASIDRTLGNGDKLSASSDELLEWLAMRRPLRLLWVGGLKHREKNV